jgi:REP element-mobilizing transposase RayT
MPRRPREHVEGGIYHVYNRLARGAEVFADRREAERFVDLLVATRDRDSLTILAWCLMSNHCHLIGTVYDDLMIISGARSRLPQRPPPAARNLPRTPVLAGASPLPP